MNNEDLQGHLKTLGLGGDVIVAPNGTRFIVARGYKITKGNLAGRTCDVAFQWSNATPYVPAAAIHTRPVLIPKGTRNTQDSVLGPEWEYWSRRVTFQPTPQAMLAHVATIFGEV